MCSSAARLNHPHRQSHSTLEEIAVQSQALLAKGVAARLIDKGEDSKEVARLIERVREAISYYQVRRSVPDCCISRY